jgi:hypothetical protein
VAGPVTSAVRSPFGTATGVSVVHNAPMPTELALRYQRLVGDPELARLWEAVCWTVVEPVSKPADVDEVIRRLGGDPADAATQPVDLGDFGAGVRCALYLGQVGPSVSIFEVGGYQGSRPEVLRVLSDGARVHSAFWTVEPPAVFGYAVYGRTLVSFSDSPHDRTGDDPDVMNPDLVDIFEAQPDNDEPGGDWRAAMLATVERRTAVRLDAAWLRRPLRRILLDPLPNDPLPPPNATGDFDLDAAYRLAAEPAQRAARAWLLRRLADDFGFDGQPDIAESIASVASGRPAGPPSDHLSVSMQISRLGKIPADSPALLLRGDEFEAHPDRRRAHASSAMAELLNLRAGSGPFPELYGLLNARFAYADRWPAIREEMRQHLTEPNRTHEPEGMSRS